MTTFAMPIKEQATRSKSCHHRRRRRRIGDSDNFDQASQVLQNFHSFGSRSLGVIEEHSESGDDNDADFPVYRMEMRRMTKARTCSCLTALAASSTVSDVCRSSTVQQDMDEWDFFAEEETNHPSSSEEKSK
jgi:hypothetical protein